MTFPALSASASVLSKQTCNVVFSPEVMQYISNVICSQQGRIKGACLNTACGDRGGKASLILRTAPAVGSCADTSQGLNQHSLLPLSAELSLILLLNKM